MSHAADVRVIENTNKSNIASFFMRAFVEVCI